MSRVQSKTANPVGRTTDRQVTVAGSAVSLISVQGMLCLSQRQGEQEAATTIKLPIILLDCLPPWIHL